jgi:hypothetical protein
LSQRETRMRHDDAGVDGSGTEALGSVFVCERELTQRRKEAKAQRGSCYVLTGIGRCLKIKPRPVFVKN